MRLHGNARTCPHSRRLIAVRVLEQGWTLARAAEAAGASVRTASKWVSRYRVEGEDGLRDRSSAPLSVPNRTREDRVEVIAVLRRLRMTAAEIAEVIGMPLSTVSAVLTRIGLGKLSRLEPLEPANRYEKQSPGELVHIDVKKLGRIVSVGQRVTGDPRRPNHRLGRRRTTGWEYVHVCVDDATRLAYVEVLPDEKAVTAVGFLQRVVIHYAAHGIEVRRVMTDNGPAYRSIAHRLACAALGLKHSRTRPYRPQTNGKAERFIRTMLDGWAYAAVYGTSNERTAALTGWLDYYNHRRPHGSLSHQTPLTRLHAIRNNPPGSYTYGFVLRQGLRA